MNNINDMFLFASVAHAGSFTAAADSLSIPKSTLSRRISELESELNIRLLERSTRSLHLTEAGKVYLQYCERIREEAEQADTAVTRLLETPQGRLKISAPLDIGQGLLTPLLPEFLRRYPDIQISCEFCNRRVDLIEEGYDLAIRVGELESSSLIARKLGRIQLRLFASKDYAAANPPPKNIRGLGRHQLLTMSDSLRNTWLLNNKDKTLALDVSSRITVNDFTSLRDLTIAGMGISLLPPYLVRDTDPIVPVLPKWSAAGADISALYPSHRGATPKLRVFLEYLAHTIQL